MRARDAASGVPRSRWNVVVLGGTAAVFAVLVRNRRWITPWDVVDAGVVDPPGFDPADIAAARAALSCPRTREVLVSVRAPLTVERFWADLVGAVERTSYRYPRDAREAADRRPG